MADVTVISSSIVQPRNTNQSGRTKIHLTPFDLNLLYVDYPQRGLLFRKPDPETRFISRLKSSLSTALEIYFPFAGRLVKVENLENNTVSFYIDCEDGLGAKFVHAESKSLSVSDILQPHGSVPDFMSHFFPSIDVKSIHGLSEPLLALQVTELKDGVFISFGYNHMVADGASIWNFFNTWSKICSNKSGHQKNLKPLVLRGWFLDKIDYPIHIPASEADAPTSDEISQMPSSKERVFHFTKKNISELKTKANGETGSSDLIISSLQALSAHLWRSIIRHSGMKREEETHCKVAVDLRQRLNPPLDKECFGNVNNLGVATVTVGELLDHEMGWAALQISKMVRPQTDEKYKTFAESWVKNVKISKTGDGSRMVCDSVVVSSSPWFDVYGNDFGWGKPIAARGGPGNSISGKLVLFQGIEEASIDVHATLWCDVLVKLLADVEFMENVTVT
ncbi:putative quinate O-hydroxycinnamoyltransferase [Arabidopsis thaliana]